MKASSRPRKPSLYGEAGLWFAIVLTLALMLVIQVWLSAPGHDVVLGLLGVMLVLMISRLVKVRNANKVIRQQFRMTTT